ncbi:MAG TPA: STAS domain-containing protein [bacterium]|nr:STAS domain-containing protein [bacterium]
MEIHISEKDGVQIISVNGDLGYDCAREFTDVMMRSVENRNPQVHVDLKNCHFMSSTSLGALAAALMVAKSRGGNIVISGVNPEVKKLLEITTLDTILEVTN